MFREQYPGTLSSPLSNHINTMFNASEMIGKEDSVDLAPNIQNSSYERSKLVEVLIIAKLVVFEPCKDRSPCDVVGKDSKNLIWLP